MAWNQYVAGRLEGCAVFAGCVRDGKLHIEDCNVPYDVEARFISPCATSCYVPHPDIRGRGGPNGLVNRALHHGGRVGGRGQRVYVRVRWATCRCKGQRVHIRSPIGASRRSGRRVRVRSRRVVGQAVGSVCPEIFPWMRQGCRMRGIKGMFAMKPPVGRMQGIPLSF